MTMARRMNFCSAGSRVMRLAFLECTVSGSRIFLSKSCRKDTSTLPVACHTMSVDMQGRA